MNPDNLAQLVRNGAGALRADKISVSDPEGVVRFRGRGLLRITADGLKLELALRGHAAPHSKRVLTEKDYWSVKGVLAGEGVLVGDLPFSAGYITPIALVGPKREFSATRTLHTLETVTRKVDPVRIRSKQRALRRRLNIDPQPRSKPGSDRSFYFHAIFVDHPLPGANRATETVTKNDFLGEGTTSHGNTFIGDTSAAEYALIRADNERDLELHFRSKPDWKSPSEKDDRRKFDALLQGLAFATGIQPWPFRTKYSRGRGFVISDTIGAAVRPPRTEFAPLSQTFGPDAGVDLAKVIRAAAEYLEADVPFNRELVKLLFLFRQAGAAQTEIATLTVCTLLESLVRAIFKHVCHKRSEASDALEPITLDTLKESFLRRVSRRAQSSKGREYERLCGRIRDAQIFQMQDIFKAVAARLNIPWHEMGPVFKEWKKARNPSAHGAFWHDVDASDEQKETEEMFYGHSRIAGAFNMILLKLFGYSGSYIASVIEGTRLMVKQELPPTRPNPQ